LVAEIVLDASVVANWLLDDEHDARAASAMAALAEAQGIVPLLWHYEMRNILLVSGRRQRLSAERASEHLAVMVELPLETDAEADHDSAFALAKKHGLTFYDALYLELAKRRHAALATADRRLLAAARAEGVAWD
jgi:predicted nucleic acid-binding protein